MLKSQTQKLCSILHQEYAAQSITELRLRFLAFTTDTLSIFGFGGSMGLQDSVPEADEWVAVMGAVTRVTPFFKQHPAIVPVLIGCPPWIVDLIWPAAAPMIKLHRRMYHEARQVLADDGKTGLHPSKRATPPKDLYEAILFSTLADNEKSVDRLAQDGFLAIGAGGDPPARTLTAAIYQLLRNAEALAKLKKELVEAMPDPTEIASLRRLEALPWLTAVLKETMRILGLVTSRLPLVAPNEALVYGQWEIPANVRCLPPPHPCARVRLSLRGKL